MARVLEFFGPESPVTKLAPRTRSLYRVPVELRYVSGGPPVERDLAEVNEGQHAAPRSRPPELKHLLPAELQPYVQPPLQMGSRHGRPDYWSPTAGVELIWISADAPPAYILQKARSAMQQLLVWDRAHPAEQSRRLALVVVAEEAGAILQGTLLERITTESHLLSIQVVYTSAIDGAVHVIEQLEAGKTAMGDDD